MTPIGHSLTGLAIACLAWNYIPKRWHPVLVLAGFCALANLPDWKLPHWGHDRYDISHSFFSNLFLIGLVAAFLFLVQYLRRRRIAWAFFAFAAVAWLSHILLDTFYNHGVGLAMFWPFGDGRLALPIPWLETLKVTLPAITPHSLKVVGLEVLTFGPLVVAALLWRHFRLNRQSF